MKLSKQEVEHISLLARVRISEKEKELFASQLSSILDYVNQLQEVKADNVAEAAQVTGLENVLRTDEIAPCDEDIRQGIFKNVPEFENDLFKTKSVFE